MNEYSFQEELRRLINRHSKENGSNTPDYLLAEYLTGCLELYEKTVTAQNAWYGFKAWPKGDPNSEVQPA